MIPAFFIPKSKLPAILLEKHTDWPKLLHWVPRRLTAFLPASSVIQEVEEFAAATAVMTIAPLFHWWLLFALAVIMLLDCRVKLLGNGNGQPIPDPGQWVLMLPLYFALHSRSGWYFRIGFRWDDVDKYFEFPAFTLKRIP